MYIRPQNHYTSLNVVQASQKVGLQCIIDCDPMILLRKMQSHATSAGDRSIRASRQVRVSMQQSVLLEGSMQRYPGEIQTASASLCSSLMPCNERERWPSCHALQSQVQHFHGWCGLAKLEIPSVPSPSRTLQDSCPVQLIACGQGQYRSHRVSRGRHRPLPLPSAPARPMRGESVGLRHSRKAPAAG